jgi:hypothetical protein
LKKLRNFGQLRSFFNRSGRIPAILTAAEIDALLPALVRVHPPIRAGDVARGGGTASPIATSARPDREILNQ